MKLGLIIQARMGSRRFPGKVLHEVAGKPLLGYLLERVQRCPSLDALIVATSDSDRDTPIAEFCLNGNVECYRGQEENVASRFYEILQTVDWDAFARISGDSPLFDPSLITRAAGLFRQGNVDLVTNVMPRTFPPGQSIEIVRTSSFIQSYPRFETSDDFEHVTRYFYRHEGEFRIQNFSSDRPAEGAHLAVDTPEQMQTFAAMVERMDRPHWEYGLDEILNLYGKVKTNT